MAPRYPDGNGVYELREYTATSETIDALHQRFERHAFPLFERHGLEVVGLWRPVDRPDSLVYLLRFPDERARQHAWANFRADPDWQRAKRESEIDGELVQDIRTTVLEPAPYSPAP